ncbi:uncharacterized protein HKW66_Vig0108540 [Vigna angularis]|uniref:Uncharacterized protein n=1 Tax=Phaseolus angularis TaxID=3914 RepID=A0A8T0KXJ5_PHAAN|nr:uncharacterized protein HKW66_Vig0108540 [Vigna angularis]
MDSFKQIWGSAEGCSSSESGWTMYIASPMQEDDAGCSNENYGNHDIYGDNRRKKQGAKVDEEESDDSMASDASSGPVHYHHAYGHSQTSHGTAASKKDKQDHGSKCSKKNASKQEKKRVDSRRNIPKHSLNIISFTCFEPKLYVERYFSLNVETNFHFKVEIDARCLVIHQDIVIDAKHS